jgi:hypothetical protein
MILLFAYLLSIFYNYEEKMKIFIYTNYYYPIEQGGYKCTGDKLGFSIIYNLIKKNVIIKDINSNHMTSERYINKTLIKQNINISTNTVIISNKILTTYIYVSYTCTEKELNIFLKKIENEFMNEIVDKNLVDKNVYIYY